MKNLIAAVIIVAGGFFLFNFAFISAAFIINTSIKLLNLPGNSAPPFLARIVYVVFILVLSWFILRSRLNDTLKATFLTMPLMVVLVSIGIFTYQLSMGVVIGLGAVIVAATLYYIRHKKLSWKYYFAVLYVAVLALMIMLLGIDI
jgi:hypothetical protein